MINALIVSFGFRPSFGHKFDHQALCQREEAPPWGSASRSMAET